MSLCAIRKAIAKLEGLQLFKTERFDKQRWHQTKWYSINYQRLEVSICSICSNQIHRLAQFEHLDLVSWSSSSTENTASTTSETTSPYTHQREQEKQTDKTVILRSCTSPVADDEMASKEPIDLDRDRSSAAADRVQNENESDASPCSNNPTIKSDISAQQANCSPPPALAKQTTQPSSNCPDEAAMREPALKSPARTQLLTKEFFQQAIANWKNRPGIGLFIHAVKSSQKPSLTKPGCGWMEWADEATKRWLMQYSQLA